MIEKLKMNKIAFGLLAPELQECLRKVGRKNVVIMSKSSLNGWRDITLTS